MKLYETYINIVSERNDLYRYQDSNQERVIHQDWNKGNLCRYVLEGAGDIFREFTKQNPSHSYINEILYHLYTYIVIRLGVLKLQKDLL